MKRILTLLACVLLLAGCLCIPVSAESAASSVNLMCTVNSEGDCLATMNVNLRLESSAAAECQRHFPERFSCFHNPQCGCHPGGYQQAQRRLYGRSGSAV